MNNLCCELSPIMSCASCGAKICQGDWDDKKRCKWKSHFTPNTDDYVCPVTKQKLKWDSGALTYREKKWNLKTLNFCCVLDPIISCEACGVIECNSCNGWIYHPYISGSSDQYTCPTTGQI